MSFLRHILGLILTSIFSFLCFSQTAAYASNFQGNSVNISNSVEIVSVSDELTQIDSCICISNDRLIMVTKSLPQIRDTQFIKNCSLFTPNFKLDSLKQQYPSIAFVNFDKYNVGQTHKINSDNDSGFLNYFNHWYWYALLALLLFVLLFNRFLLNFARQSTNFPHK
ncbi:MAG: hypothetical protein IT245_08895 [Bacteroidia bacterium]|nr:hypothetical protein [Bacteroidia bacterium]